MPKIKISAILLAAGQSTRMGGFDKLLLDYKGKKLLQHAVELLDTLPCQEKILVTTPEKLIAVNLPETILTVINPNPQNGQSESVRLGIGAATGGSYLFLNADQPKLTRKGLLELFKLAEENPDKIIYPSVNGNPSTPVMFPARFRNDLLALRGDTGGRALREAFSFDCISFKAENPDDFADIDFIEDYKKATGGN